MYTVDIFPDFAVLKEQSNQIFDLQFFVIRTYLGHWPTGLDFAAELFEF